jgi:hypothetical protein
MRQPRCRIASLLGSNAYYTNGKKKAETELLQYYIDFRIGRNGCRNDGRPEEETGEEEPIQTPLSFLTAPQQCYYGSSLTATLNQWYAVI